MSRLEHDAVVGMGGTTLSVPSVFSAGHLPLVRPAPTHSSAMRFLHTVRLIAFSDHGQNSLFVAGHKATSLGLRVVTLHHQITDQELSELLLPAHQGQSENLLQFSLHFEVDGLRGTHLVGQGIDGSIRLDC